MRIGSDQKKLADRNPTYKPESDWNLIRSEKIEDSAMIILHGLSIVENEVALIFSGRS